MRLSVFLLASSAAAMSALPAFAQTHDTIETVVVTASPFAQPTNQYASIVSVVSRDQILAKAGANLSDALRVVPGMASSGFSAASSRPVIRGMDSARVRVLENGLSSSDVSDIAPDHGVPIDPMVTQRLEVVSGAAALRYGSQAIGGVVNAINNRVPLSVPETFRADANMSYDSVTDGGQAGVMFDGALGQAGLHADGFIRRQGDYMTPLGTQTNTFSHQDGFSGGASYFFGDSRVGASVTHFDANYGIPADTAHIVMRQTKINTDDSIAIGAGPLKTVNVQASYSWYGHNEEDGGALVSTFLNKELDSRIEAVFDTMGIFANSAAGLQIQDRKYSGLGADQNYLFPTQTQTRAGYVFTEVPFGDDVKLQLAGRAEQVHVSGTPASNIYTARNFTPLSGSVSLLWNITDQTRLGVTATTAGRAPAQTELYARGAHDGPATFEVGDPNLKIERANSLEATLRTQLGPVHFEGALWGTHFNHYIYGNLTGQFCDEDGNCDRAGTFGPLKQFFFSQASANFWGIEGKADAALFDFSGGTLSANMMADYVRATLARGLGNVPRIQPYRVGGGLAWDGDSLNLSFMVLGVGAQHVIGAFGTPTEGYIDVSLQAHWRPFPGNSNFEVVLSGQNLADQVERNAVAINKDVVAMPGRGMRILLRQSF